MKKIISFLICIITVFSFTACNSCKGGKPDDGGNDSSSKHEYAPTGNYILKDGKTSYKVVVPKE